MLDNLRLSEKALNEKLLVRRPGDFEYAAVSGLFDVPTGQIRRTQQINRHTTYAPEFYLFDGGSGAHAGQPLGGSA